MNNKCTLHVLATCDEISQRTQYHCTYIGILVHVRQQAMVPNTWRNAPALYTYSTRSSSQ